GVDGPPPRAMGRQPAHPPARRLHRPTRPEGDAHRGAVGAPVSGGPRYGGGSTGAAPSFCGAGSAVRGRGRRVNLVPPFLPAPPAMATTVQEVRPQPVTRYKIRTGMLAWML